LRGQFRLDKEGKVALATAFLGFAGDALLSLAVLAGFSTLTIALLIPVILAHPLRAFFVLLLVAGALTK
jgi:hypothetical protein